MSQLSFLEAALAVLESAGRPMTTVELTEEAIRRGLLNPTGKTPRATMAATLYVHVRDHPDGRLLRAGEVSGRRALRGSVRWAVRPSA